MPGRNGMGPLGEGPMTGWGLGRCRPANVRVGRGRGRRGRGTTYSSGGGRYGWGGIPGWMRLEVDEPNARAPLREEILRRQAEMLRRELARIEALLKDEETTERQEPS